MSASNVFMISNCWNNFAASLIIQILAARFIPRFKCYSEHYPFRLGIDWSFAGCSFTICSVQHLSFQWQSRKIKIRRQSMETVVGRWFIKKKKENRETGYIWQNKREINCETLPTVPAKLKFTGNIGHWNSRHQMIIVWVGHFTIAQCGLPNIVCEFHSSGNGRRSSTVDFFVSTTAETAPATGFDYYFCLVSIMLNAAWNDSRLTPIYIIHVLGIIEIENNGHAHTVLCR